MQGSVGVSPGVRQALGTSHSFSCGFPGNSSLAGSILNLQCGREGGREERWQGKETQGPFLSSALSLVWSVLDLAVSSRLAFSDHAGVSGNVGTTHDIKCAAIATDIKCWKVLQLTTDITYCSSPLVQLCYI